MSCYSIYDSRNPMNWVDVFNEFNGKHPHKLLLGNLSWQTSEEELVAAFKKININVTGISIFEDAANGCSIGFCCIAFASEKSLDAARKEVTNLDLKSTKLTFHEFTFNNLVALFVDAKTKGRIRMMDPDESEENDDSVNESEQHENTQDPQDESRSSLHPYEQNWPWRLPAQPCVHNRWKTRPCWPLFHNFPKRMPPYLPPRRLPYHQRYHHQSLFRLPWAPRIPVDSFAISRNEFMNDKEFDEILEQNKAISSAAIQQSVALALDGDTKTAKKVLLHAIAAIEDSKVSEDDRCRILLQGLRDTFCTVREQDEEFYEHEQRSDSARKKKTRGESCHHHDRKTAKKRPKNRSSSSSSCKTQSSHESAKASKMKGTKAKRALPRKSEL